MTWTRHKNPEPLQEASACFVRSVSVLGTAGNQMREYLRLNTVLLCSCSSLLLPRPFPPSGLFLFPALFLLDGKPLYFFFNSQQSLKIDCYGPPSGSHLVSKFFRIHALTGPFCFCCCCCTKLRSFHQWPAASVEYTVQFLVLSDFHSQRRQESQCHSSLDLCTGLTRLSVNI